MANPLYDALFRTRSASDATFLVQPGGGAMTYAGFAARAGRLAGALAAAGVAPGDRVAAQIDKSPDALALHAACLRAGAVFLPLNPAYTEAETAHFLADAAPRLFVSAPARAQALADTVRAAGARLATLGTDGTGSLAEAAAEAAALPPVARAPADRRRRVQCLCHREDVQFPRQGGRDRGAQVLHIGQLEEAGLRRVLRAEPECLQVLPDGVHHVLVLAQILFAG